MMKGEPIVKTRFSDNPEGSFAGPGPKPVRAKAILEAANRPASASARKISRIILTLLRSAWPTSAAVAGLWSGRFGASMGFFTRLTFSRRAERRADAWGRAPNARKRAGNRFFIGLG